MVVELCSYFYGYQVNAHIVPHFFWLVNYFCNCLQLFAQTAPNQCSLVFYMCNYLQICAIICKKTCKGLWFEYCSLVVLSSNPQPLWFHDKNFFRDSQAMSNRQISKKERCSIHFLSFGIFLIACFWSLYFCWWLVCHSMNISEMNMRCILQSYLWPLHFWTYEHQWLSETQNSSIFYFFLYGKMFHHFWRVTQQHSRSCHRREQWTSSRSFL